jgi:hypothetical protein
MQTPDHYEEKANNRLQSSDTVWDDNPHLAEVLVEEAKVYALLSIAASLQPTVDTRVPKHRDRAHPYDEPLCRCRDCVQWRAEEVPGNE